jgi:IS5 family transposase
LDFHDKVPDANTIRLFKEQLKEHKLIKVIFDKFNQMLKQKGFISQEGSIIDATIVDVPKQRNTRDENKDIKKGKVPESWKENPNKMSQKDTDARWLKYGDRKHYGYKNHARVDKKSKLIEDYEVTPASTHDSKAGAKLLVMSPEKIPVWANKAYSGSEIEEIITKKKMKNNILRKAKRNKPLSEKEKKINKKLSKIRARVEHVFADIEKFKGDFIRTIGIERAEFQIGLTNLVYNMRRFTHLQSLI